MDADFRRVRAARLLLTEAREEIDAALKGLTTVEATSAKRADSASLHSVGPRKQRAARENTTERTK